MIGRVYFFKSEQYGLISIEGDGREFFFSARSIIGEVRRGDEVEFWLGDGRSPGQLIAVDVRPAEGLYGRP